MAVSFDAASESHTGTITSQGEASFTWNHLGASSGVKGVVVFVFNLTSASDLTTGVTYGGVAMSAVTAGFAADTAGEAGSCKAYFLGASVPQGTQAIVVTRTNNAAEMYAAAASVLASGDTAYTGVLLEQENQALAEENIDDGSPGSNSVRFAGTFSGLANITAALVPGANSTLIGGIDAGAIVAMAVYETTAGQGSRPVGFVGATDDVAAVYLAVKESVSGTPHTATQTDPEGLLDSIAQVADYATTKTDPEGLLDSIAQVTDSIRDQTDLEGLLDSAVQVTDSVRDQTDNLGLVDDVSYQVSTGTEQTVTDPLGLTDSVIQVADQLRDQTDPLGLTDSVAQVADSVRDQTDPLGLVDDVTYDHTTGGIAHTATVTDPLGLLDSATPAQDHVRDLTDNFGLVDDGDWIAVGADAVGILDTVTTELSMAVTFTDPLGLVDSVTYDLTIGGIAHTATVTDSLGLLDDVTFLAAYNPTIVDLLGLTDSVTRSGDMLRDVTDLLGLLDDITTQLTGPGFWALDPAGYTANPAGYTANPAAYVPVGPDDTPPPW